MTPATGRPSPAETAQRMVDLGEPRPAGLDAVELKALAWALKDLCYAAWSSEPQRAARAAGVLGGLLEPATQAERPKDTAHTRPDTTADTTPDTTAAADPQPEIAALAQWTAGIALVTRGQMAEAIVSFDHAAEGFTRLAQAGPAAQTQVPKIMALSMLGHHDDAAACAEATQRAFVQQGDVHAASKVSLNLGSLRLRHDHYADAARHYREAALLFSRVGDKQHSVMADIGLADALTALGQLDEASRIYARARLRAQAHGLPVLEALVDESVALLELARGHYGLALAGFESARGRYERLAMPQHLAIAEKQLADAYLELRLLPEALALFGQALAKFDALQMPDDKAWTLTQRGRAQAWLGQTAAAADSFVSAAALFHAQGSGAGQAAVALARAELALAQGGHAAAACSLADEAARGYGNAGLAEGGARASVVLAHALLASGSAPAAAALFAATLAQAREAQMLTVQGRCLAGQALAAQALGAHAAAREGFDAAVALFEDQRRALPGDELRSAFLSDHLLPYRELLRYALQAHAEHPSPEAAAAVLTQHERVRARVLGERLAEGDAAGPAQPLAAPGAGHDALQDLRARFNWLYRRAQGLLDDDTPASPALAEELRRTERELLERTRRAGLVQPVAATAPAALADDGAFSADALRAALAEGDALVEYGVLDDELFACVVRPSEVTLLRRLAHWPEVLAALHAARFQLEALSHGSAPLARHLALLTTKCQARLAHLHALLWAPLPEWLAACRRVLVVAPAQLGALPFGALHEGGVALAERHELALAPSAHIALQGLLRRVKTPRHALVLAESSRLLHAAAEAERVAALFPQPGCLVDQQATLAALRRLAPAADVIHLACHAQFRSDNPAFSALHLHDGALTAELAQTLNLRAGVVVLSGCETGLAEGAGGDEMVGLVRAFLVAGAARVVASLWPVDDEVTGLFMSHFYRALSQGSAPAAALQSAQAAVRQRHAHPFYWAAFALYGGW